MPIIVQKFGGTSVADSEKILAAARKAIRAQKDGNQVVMVVSAMGKNTDMLVELAQQITEEPPAREMALRRVSPGWNSTPPGLLTSPLTKKGRYLTMLTEILGSTR